jgi:hypothetical protein
MNESKTGIPPAKFYSSPLSAPHLYEVSLVSSIYKSVNVCYQEMTPNSDKSMIFYREKYSTSSIHNTEISRELVVA